MYGFGKTEMDIDAAKIFWAWFLENEKWIISNLDTSGMDVVWAIDSQIKPVFPYFKEELEFELGFNDGVGEFYFFHFGNSNLACDSKILREMMPKELNDRWIFYTNN